MARVLTENQVLLTGYLAAVGCDRIAVLSMVLKLWEEDDVIEMLDFCRDHPNASEAELLKMSSIISTKNRIRKIFWGWTKAFKFNKKRKQRLQ